MKGLTMVSKQSMHYWHAFRNNLSFTSVELCKSVQLGVSMAFRGSIGAFFPSFLSQQ